MRKIASHAAATLIATTGLTVAALTPAGPARAQASCTGTSNYVDVKGCGVIVPAIGNGTHNDNCLPGAGNDSQAVAALQETLDGCYHAGLAADGDYGPLTQQAVENAQWAAHVTVDGVYGPRRAMPLTGGISATTARASRRYAP